MSEGAVIAVVLLVVLPFTWILGLDQAVWLAVGGVLGLSALGSRRIPRSMGVVVLLFVVVSAFAGARSATGIRVITLVRDLLIALAFFGSMFGSLALFSEGINRRGALLVFSAVVGVCTTSALLSIVAVVVQDPFTFTTPIAGLVPEVVRSTPLGTASLVERGVAGQSSLLGEEFFRPRGLFLFSTSQAVAQATLILPILGMARSFQRRRGRVLLALAAGANVVSLFATTTRMAIAAFLVVASFVSVAVRPQLIDRRRWATIQLLLPLMLLAMLLVVAGTGLGGAITRAVMDRSGQTRLDLYMETIETWTQRPLLGWGTSIDAPGSSALGPPLGSHSQYLAVLFKQGLVGFVLFGALVVLVARSVRRGLSSEARASWLLAGGFVVSLISALTEEIWLDPATAVVVGICWGMAAAGGPVAAAPPNGMRVGAED